MELVIRKCMSCGATIKVLEDCNCDDCGIICCNEKMRELKANESDGAIEKHKPVVEKDNCCIRVTVNHVMDVDHYIEWICLVRDNREEYVYFRPGEEAKCAFEDVSTGTIYSYCNKHGLWKTEF